MNLVCTMFKKRVIPLHGHEFTNNRQKGKFEDIPFQLFTKRNKSLNQRFFLCFHISKKGKTFFSTKEIDILQTTKKCNYVVFESNDPNVVTAKFLKKIRSQQSLELSNNLMLNNFLAV